MARPAKETASLSVLPPALLRYVAARQKAPALLTERVKLPENAAVADEVTITPSALASMMRVTAEVLAEPHVGLRFASQLPMRRYDGASLAARAAASGREVLAAIARFAPLLFPQLEAQLRSTHDEVVLSARVVGHPRGLGLELDEYLLSLVMTQLRRGGDLVPRRAWLMTSRPADINPLYVALATHDIAFGAADTGLAISTADADRPLPGADPIFAATAEHIASDALRRTPRPGALAEAVASKIEAALAEDVGAETIAASLHMSARTLQRRLEDEGARFSEIVDVVRQRVARKLVDDRSVPLTEVAFRVGFRDLATFSRAFKRWTGLPPGAFRRRM